VPAERRSAHRLGAPRFALVHAHHQAQSGGRQRAAVTDVNELSARCGCLFRCLDEPDLYSTAVGLEGYGARSWNFAIMSHILGTAQLDMEPLPHRLNHLDTARHLARRDPLSFGGADADAFCRGVGLGTPDDQPHPMP
jgi:hypothetical protein